MQLPYTYLATRIISKNALFTEPSVITLGGYQFAENNKPAYLYIQGDSSCSNTVTFTITGTKMDDTPFERTIVMPVGANNGTTWNSAQYIDTLPFKTIDEIAVDTNGNPTVSISAISAIFSPLNATSDDVVTGILEQMGSFQNNLDSAFLDEAFSGDMSFNNDGQGFDVSKFADANSRNIYIGFRSNGGTDDDSISCNIIGKDLDGNTVNETINFNVGDHYVTLLENAYSKIDSLGIVGNGHNVAEIDSRTFDGTGTDDCDISLSEYTGGADHFEIEIDTTNDVMYTGKFYQIDSYLLQTTINYAGYLAGGKLPDSFYRLRVEGREYAFSGATVTGTMNNGQMFAGSVSGVIGRFVSYDAGTNTVYMMKLNESDPDFDDADTFSEFTFTSVAPTAYDIYLYGLNADAGILVRGLDTPQTIGTAGREVEVTFPNVGHLTINAVLDFAFVSGGFKYYTNQPINGTFEIGEPITFDGGTARLAGINTQAGYIILTDVVNEIINNTTIIGDNSEAEFIIALGGYGGTGTGKCDTFKYTCNDETKSHIAMSANEWVQIAHGFSVNFATQWGHTVGDKTIIDIATNTVHDGAGDCELFAYKVPNKVTGLVNHKIKIVDLVESQAISQLGNNSSYGVSYGTALRLDTFMSSVPNGKKFIPAVTQIGKLGGGSSLNNVYLRDGDSGHQDQVEISLSSVDDFWFYRGDNLSAINMFYIDSLGLPMGNFNGELYLHLAEITENFEPVGVYVIVDNQEQKFAPVFDKQGQEYVAIGWFGGNDDPLSFISVGLYLSGANIKMTLDYMNRSQGRFTLERFA